VACGVEVVALRADFGMIEFGDDECFGAYDRRDDPFAVRPGDAGTAVGSGWVVS